MEGTLGLPPKGAPGTNPRGEGRLCPWQLCALATVTSLLGLGILVCGGGKCLLHCSRLVSALPDLSVIPSNLRSTLLGTV